MGFVDALGGFGGAEVGVGLYQDLGECRIQWVGDESSFGDIACCGGI
jgi:hypothetical protein